MEPAQVLDGKVLAAKLRSKVASTVAELQATIPGFKPHLSIVQVSIHSIPYSYALESVMTIQYWQACIFHA